MKGRSVAALLSALATLIIIIALPSASTVPVLHAATSGSNTSTRTGKWSDPTLWSFGRVPTQADQVVIASGHVVTYDVFSSVEIGRVLIEGSLIFARDKNTRLDVAGNVIVDTGGYLEMGTLANPLPATVAAAVRFAISPNASCTGGSVFVESDTGLWVMSGGRWEAHGAPVHATWSKLYETAAAGVSMVRVVDDMSDWPVGSTVVLTPTDMGARTPDVINDNYPMYEERQIVSAIWRTAGYTELQLSASLRYKHEVVGNAAGEAALLSHNVLITSKYPSDVLDAHTMFMSGSMGGISYAEFREMGAFGCQSRYPVHFHMMGDTSRGMIVKGASIWRSNNNFMNIHGSSGITVEDTVGYDTTGVGYYIGEPAVGMHSTDSVFVDNMAARIVYREGAIIGRQRASGFWIQSMNSTLIGNVASGSWAYNDDSGFHIVETDEFTPGFSSLLMVRNEAHSNNTSGMFTWKNGLPLLTVIDFRAWRNGLYGFNWGAYHNFMQVYRAMLFENGTYNFKTTATHVVLVDSRLYGTTAYPTGTGAFIGGYFVSNDPTTPAMFVRDVFTGHPVHVSQDHSPCGQPLEEIDPLSQVCSATYFLFWQNQFNGGKAFDFGWHRNANSYFKVGSWQGTANPPITATNFALARKDRAQPSASAYYYGPFDAWLNPAALVPATGVPALATLAGLTDGAPLGGTVAFQLTISSPNKISKVAYYVDERLLAAQTAGPFSYAWNTAGWTRRYAHVYAAVTDSNGNTSYTQVVRLRK